NSIYIIQYHSQVRDLSIGEGKLVRKGDKVRVLYEGRLSNSKGSVFDKTKDPKRAFSFIVGDGQVIKGWDVGVIGMRRGGERTLVIPPKMGYGHHGSLPEIPSNATLHFWIKVI
ncbi:MAG: putative Peptidyl-prolyl cis-trans isomerase, partial [Streblomastix strix]